MAKLVRSRWLEMGQVLSLPVYGLRLCIRHKHAKMQLGLLELMKSVIANVKVLHGKVQRP